MTDHKPLTTQQLAEIEARMIAATPGPWVRYEEYGPTFYANTSGEYLRGVGDFNFGVGDQADADEAFVRHAPEDVRLLLAEVRRLQAELADFSGRVNELESQLCECQPVREHDDLRRPAFYQHEAHCPAAVSAAGESGSTR